MKKCSSALTAWNRARVSILFSGGQSKGTTSLLRVGILSTREFCDFDRNKAKKSWTLCTTLELGETGKGEE